MSEAQEGELAEVVEEAGAVVTPLARASFDSTAAEGRVAGCFKVASLDGFAAFGRAEVGALGAIIDYLELTQRGRLPLLRPPVREAAGGQMRIDAATRRNLELTRGAAGGREGSLLAAIDRTVTGGGARLLETRVTAPSTDVRLVRARQAAVAFFVEDGEAGRACASGCAGCRTWSGRCRGWRWGAAGRGISPRCATGSAQAGGSRRRWAGERAGGAGARRGRRSPGTRR